MYLISCCIKSTLGQSMSFLFRASFSCAYSNSGMLLAIASIEANSFPIKIYQAQTGERMATLQGHVDLVYQLQWSENDE